MFNHKQIIFSLALSLLILAGCDSGRVYDENQSIKKGIWTIDDVKKYDVEIKDTISIYDFYVNVRHAGNYRYSNLYLFIKTVFPNNQYSRDTIECVLADDNGEWYGNGIGDIKDNRILFKRGLRFPVKGNYSFYVQQGMREENLEGIMDLGLRIQKQK